MSLQETSFEYEHILWVCEFLPYRIIVCVDAIQYIVQKREQNMYRNLSFFTEFYAIARQYPQLAMNGLPSETFGLLSHEIRRRINRTNETSILPFQLATAGKPQLYS